LFSGLGEGIDPNQKSDDISANTALHVAAKAGHHQIVLYLLLVGCFHPLFCPAVAMSFLYPPSEWSETGGYTVFILCLSVHTHI